MRKKTLKAILFWFTVLTIAIAVNSCGTAKKKIQEQTKLQEKELLVVSDNSDNSSQNVSVKVTETKDAASQTVTVKKTYTPILPDKKAVAVDSQGKRVELDNASYTEETTTYQAQEKQRNSKNSEEFHQKAIISKSQIKTKEKEKTKELDKVVDRSTISFSVWIWMLLIAIALLVVIYLKYRFKWISNVTAYFKK